LDTVLADVKTSAQNRFSALQFYIAGVLFRRRLANPAVAGYILGKINSEKREDFILQVKV